MTVIGDTIPFNVYTGALSRCETSGFYVFTYNLKKFYFTAQLIKGSYMWLLRDHIPVCCFRMSTTKTLQGVALC